MKNLTTIPLQLEADQTARLVALNAQLQQELETRHFPQPATVHALKTALADALDRQPGFAPVWDGALTQAQTLCFAHDRTEIRNLPWQLALEDRPLLALVKSPRADLPAHTPALGLPLKVLVMVSAPEGATPLDHELEELRLLRAFAPLMSKGLAQVHFTDDGSLENLQTQLAENRYHILHFSGHGSYEGDKGILLLEDEDSGRPCKVSARDFNLVLAEAAESGHRPELVVLSACQSAQGQQSGDLQGVADTLLAGGVPAVVAMAASILDSCATEFSTALYEFLAKEKPLPAAFRDAVRQLREFETTRFDRRGGAPGQWLIPQLLVSAAVSALTDASRPVTELDFKTDMAFVKGEKGLLTLARRSKDYVFIGRRSERRTALGHLREGRAVLLRGQGGVGKTALAEHLAVRMLAGNQRHKVFVHSEKAPTLESLLNELRDYLARDKRQTAVVSELAAIEKQLDKLLFLLQRVGEYCDPIFIFDNVETYQVQRDGDWVWHQEKHADVFEGLQTLRQFTKYPVLLTGRYPLQELPGLELCDLNAVNFTDFYKKCWQLPLSRLADQLAKRAPDPAKGADDATAPPPSFEDVAKLLHRAFGGNYRALEFFDELYTQKPAQIFDTLDRLEALEQSLGAAKAEVLQRMSENLVFGELLALLTPAETEALALLARFRIPVLPMALGMQREHRDYSAALDRLADLTLAERRSAGEGRKWYYVMPLVKDLLAGAELPEGAFSELVAGDYHDAMVQQDVSMDGLSDYGEAFEWYYAAGAVEGVNRIGLQLCDFYYRLQQFQLALVYGLRTEEIAGEALDRRIRNNIGLVFHLFGQGEKSLRYFEKVLPHLKQIGDLKNEGATLNNISQIYEAKGDYDTALRYLEQSLKIVQETGDRKGEGATLNNLAANSHAKGDYDTGLRYLQQSLKIRQEIGDREGEGVTLSNIGQFYSSKSDYDTALHYLQQSLKIQQEIGDRMGGGATLNSIGNIHFSKGDYDTALHYLQQSLKIMQEIGDRHGEGTTLNNIGQIHKIRGDYDTALRHLLQSLKIRQEIGDRKGEGTTLNNISLICSAEGDNEAALRYLKQSLKITQEIGDRQGEGATLNNISQIHQTKGNYDAALRHLQQSIKILQEIGDRQGEGMTLNNLAIATFAKGDDYDTAWRYLKQSLKIQQEIGDVNGMATTLTNMGSMFFEQNKFEEAVLPLMQAYQIFQQIGSPNVQKPGAYLNAIIEKIGEARFQQLTKNQ